MWTGSDRLVSCLRHSHQEIRTKVDVLVDGIVEASITGVELVDPLTGQKAGSVDGVVNVKRAQVRRETDVKLADLSAIPGDLTPTDAKDLFAPLRSELRVWRGYEFWDASPYEKLTGTGVDYWPLGTFIIDKASMDWPNLALHGFDRMWNLRGKFEKPWVVPNASQNMDQLERLLRASIPSAQQDIDLPFTGTETPGLLWDQQDDKLQRANDLCVADGLTLYANPMGTIKARQEDQVDDGLVVWEFASGDSSISANPTREIVGTDAFNVVVASSESDGSIVPVSGTAVDDNPDSFTYIGKTARVPFFYTSPLLRTPTQCVLAARTILSRELGISDQIVVPTIPLPGLESGDVISVHDDKTKSSGLYLADEFSIPLRASGGLMSISCRTQRLL